MSLVATCNSFRPNHVSKTSTVVARYFWRRTGPTGPSWADLIKAKDETIEKLEETIEKFETTIKKFETTIEKIVAGKDETIAGKDETIKKMEETIIAKTELMAASLTAHEAREFQLKRELDIVRGVGDARSLLEACIRDLYATFPSGKYTTVTKMFERILNTTDGCSGLTAYLKVAATDNQEDSGNLLKDAGKLWSVYSSPAHSQGPNGCVTLPTAMFATSGRATMIALAAILRFSGRNISLYNDILGQGSVSSGILLRPVPLSKCSATEAEILLLSPTVI